MMKRIHFNKSIYEFAPSMGPVLTVLPSETLIFETIDAFGG